MRRILSSVNLAVSVALKFESVASKPPRCLEGEPPRKLESVATEGSSRFVVGSGGSIT